MTVFDFYFTNAAEKIAYAVKQVQRWKKVNCFYAVAMSVSWLIFAIINYYDYFHLFPISYQILAPVGRLMLLLTLPIYSRILLDLQEKRINPAIVKIASINILRILGIGICFFTNTLACPSDGLIMIDLGVSAILILILVPVFAIEMIYLYDLK